MTGAVRIRILARAEHVLCEATGVAKFIFGRGEWSKKRAPTIEEGLLEERFASTKAVILILFAALPFGIPFASDFQRLRVDSAQTEFGYIAAALVNAAEARVLFHKAPPNVGDVVLGARGRKEAHAATYLRRDRGPDAPV
jgi:hypothetical protein